MKSLVKANVLAPELGISTKRLACLARAGKFWSGKTGYRTRWYDRNEVLAHFKLKGTKLLNDIVAPAPLTTVGDPVLKDLLSRLDQI